MTARIIDGKAHAAGLRERVAQAASTLKQDHDLVPGLAAILIGDDPASEVYVRGKGKATREAGMNSFEFKMPANTLEKTLLAKIGELNKDPAVHGILMQLPVPDQIDPRKVIETIDPAKDVDGLHPINAGYLLSGHEGTVPCTPLGCLMLIKDRETRLAGKRALIIGRSVLVGRPMAILLLKENCTVIMTHSRTRDLADECRRADILVAAAGRERMIEGNWVKPGAIVIDVGITRVPAPERGEGKTRLVGDVDFDEAKQVAGAITPVPGGVGPMTIACLLRNTLIAACRQNNVDIPEL